MSISYIVDNCELIRFKIENERLVQDKKNNIIECVDFSTHEAVKDCINDIENLMDDTGKREIIFEKRKENEPYNCEFVAKIKYDDNRFYVCTFDILCIEEKSLTYEDLFS